MPKSTAAKKMRSLTLAEIRKELGVSQAKLAERCEMSQGALSREERRSDHLVSTLRRYIECLGGELIINAVVKGKRHRISGG